VRFLVHKAALGQVSSEYCCSAFHHLLHTHHHFSSSGPGTIGHLVASIIVDAVPLHPKKQMKSGIHSFPLYWNALDVNVTVTLASLEFIRASCMEIIIIIIIIIITPNGWE
jgi:hypothetical protein